MFTKPKVKLLFAISNLTYGGIQTQALSLAKAYQKKGAKIYFLWTSKYEATFVEKELLSNNFQIIDGRFIIDDYWLKYSWKLNRYLPIFKAAFILRFYRISYVIPYHNQLSYFFGTIHNFTGVKKTIFHIRNTVEEREPRQNWYFKRALQNKPPVIANSNHARIKFKELYGELYDLEIYTINNGINIRSIDGEKNWKAHFQVESIDFVVSVIANFFKEKDFITVFRAWKCFLEQTNSNSKLVIAGDEGVAGMMNAYKDKVNELGITPHVVFLGRAAQNIELLSITDCNVLSTLNEGLPNSVIETLAMGKPFAGTNVDGVREVVGENYPIPLFEKGDDKQLSEILIKLYNKQFDLKEISEYSLKRFDLFSIDKLVENYSKIIKV
ncbi:glycosyltransferase family 4 protein [Winogradskyella wichelsiae]|uniref:glycosyltransferase family 4 protein n=1 Tax=Winogradskyella wichelsiae TaxID=2697007 RepID=UPI0015C722CD|nr:glycosyltransferase family 4 protein [Winogradskyella wichelsiae]